MIKQLLDMGHAIGTIAVLYTKVIAAMLVADQFAKAFSSGALTVVGRCADPAKAVSALDKVRTDRDKSA